MSPFAPAPSGAAPGPAQAVPRRAVPDATLAAGLAGALALLAFLTTGGSDLAANTWTEIALVLLGAAAAAASMLGPTTGRRHGLGTLVAFGALSALTTASIAWSLVPDQSWLEANRMIAYLAAFGLALAAVRAAPERWRSLVVGIGMFTTGLSAWALASKVVPAALDPGELFGRLRLPFDYWNATGVTAAMGLPVLIWAGARHESSRAARALAVPSIAVLLIALVLTESRSAMLAALCGLGLWFVLVPLRLRAALLLAAGALTALGPAAWTLTHHALTRDRTPLAERVSAGQGFGPIVLAALLAGAAAAWWVAPRADRISLGAAARRRVGWALIAAVALVPAGLLAGAAASSRGLTGEVSHQWQVLTNPDGGAGNAPGRLVELGNSRGLYWRTGLTVGGHHPLAGAGAGAFRVVHARYTRNRRPFSHAHSYVIETFADLGVLGLLVSLGLLVTWAGATARTFGRGRNAPQLAPAERVGLLTLLAIVVTFGVQSSVDWTWEIPGTAVPALLAAGWLAGRGSGVPARRRPGPATVPGLAVLLAVVLLAAWAIWQPLRAADALTAAEDALLAGHGDSALTDARAAAADNPLSPEPLWMEADVLSATGRPEAARTALLRAVSLEPESAEPWRRLGQFDLAHRRRSASNELARAGQLDPAGPPPAVEAGA